jgi:arsenic resistance protein ArsH
MFLFIQHLTIPRLASHLKTQTSIFYRYTSTINTPTMTFDINYKPYLLQEEQKQTDWVADLELDSASQSGMGQDPVKVLVLYGSLRKTSYSRFLAYEFARILDKLGADVKVFDPTGLPVKDDVSQDHPKVQEIRALSTWSQAQVWVCPEQHGAITAVFKNQIDWIPLSIGSVRPTQGRTLAIAQVSGGSQSFNTVNTLRLLGRWMRMFTIPNQSSVPKAWTEFDSNGRMKESDLRDRVVDVAEELFRMTLVLRPHADRLVDRYSERKEKLEKGRLLTQQEKEESKSMAK